MTPERRANISRALKGSKKLSEAMKRVHARRLATGEDKAMRNKIRRTRIAAGDWTQYDQSAWAEYKRQVRVETDKQPLHTLQHIEKRGRGPGRYHLDHIVSQKTGFDLHLLPWFIGNIINLRMIPEGENCAKQHFSDEDEIISLWYSLTEVLDP